MYSYPGGVSQIILNLVNNSLKHGFKDKDEGRIDIDVGLEDQHVVIEVRDDGVGMSEEIRSRIYEPFSLQQEKKVGAV